MDLIIIFSSQRQQAERRSCKIFRSLESFHRFQVTKIYMLFVCLPSIYMCVVCGPLKRTRQIGKSLSTLQATAKEKDFSEIFGSLRIQQALKLIAFCIS